MWYVICIPHRRDGFSWGMSVYPMLHPFFRATIVPMTSPTCVCTQGRAMKAWLLWLHSGQFWRVISAFEFSIGSAGATVRLHGSSRSPVQCCCLPFHKCKSLGSPLINSLHSDVHCPSLSVLLREAYLKTRQTDIYGHPVCRGQWWKIHRHLTAYNLHFKKPNYTHTHKPTNTRCSVCKMLLK